jgi:hypothetical protein
LLQGYQSFVIDSQAEASAAARKAVDEFLLEVEAFPPVLRRRIARRTLDEQAEWLQMEVADEIPRRADNRKEDLETDFGLNCSRASREAVNEGTKRLSRWPSWSPELEAEWIGLFSDAVRYDDLPEELQRLVAGVYRNWTDQTAAGLQEEIEFRCNFWSGVMKNIASVVIVLVSKIFWDFRHRKGPIHYLWIHFPEVFAIWPIESESNRGNLRDC